MFSFSAGLLCLLLTGMPATPMQPTRIPACLYPTRDTISHSGQSARIYRPMAIDGYAIAAVGVGGILLWSSVRNEKILAVTRDLIAGKKPPPEGPGEAISGGT